MTKDQIRADFPLCTQAIDQFRAVFGAGVKPLYFSDGGKTMGKQQPFEGTDVDKIIRMADMDASRGARTR